MVINMTLLILSCGTRNKLVEFFKESGYEKIVVTDCSELAPALYVADAYYIVPRMDQPEYLDEILAICEKENVQAVLPLQEDELHFIAERKDIFLKNSITPIVSELDDIDICRDKMKFYHFLKENNLPTLPSYSTVEEFMSEYEQGKEIFPVFVKPISGCGSIGTMKVGSVKLLQALEKESEYPLMIQRLSKGKEYGADIYVDLVSGKVTDIFLKEKIRMRAGETEKSVSVKNEEIFELVRKTVEQLKLKGPIDMDIFESEGKYYVSEINPRFGGGYPHAYACGVNFPESILKNLHGEENDVNIGNYVKDVYVMKYSDIIVRNEL